MSYVQYLKLWRITFQDQWIDLSRLAPLAFGARTVVRTQRKPLLLPESRPLDHLSDSTDGETLKDVLAAYLAGREGRKIHGYQIEREGELYRLTTIAPVVPARRALPETRKRPEVKKVIGLCGRAFTRCYVELFERTADTHAALMLAQLIYWREVFADTDGWVRKTAQEWQAATGLTRREQQRARAKLVNTGLWLEEQVSRCETRYAPAVGTEALCKGRWIAFRPALFHLIGDVKASLLLSSGLSWSEHSAAPDGSFSRSGAQWCHELALGRHELTSAFKKLEGIWHTALDTSNHPLHWLDTETLITRLAQPTSGCTKTEGMVHPNHTVVAPKPPASAPEPLAAGTLKNRESKREMSEKRGTAGPSAPSPSLRSGGTPVDSDDTSAAPTEATGEDSLNWKGLFHRLRDEVDRERLLNAYRAFLGYKQVTQDALWALHDVVGNRHGTHITSEMLMESIEAATAWAQQQGRTLNHNPAAIGVEMDKRIEAYWERERERHVAEAKKRRNQKRWGEGEWDGLI